MPPELMVGDVPGWAYDLYSREGRRALGTFLEGEMTETARWVGDHIPPRPPSLAFIGGIVFRVEGGAGKISTAMADRGRAKATSRCRMQWAALPRRHRSPPADAQTDIPILNEVRAQLILGGQHPSDFLTDLTLDNPLLSTTHNGEFGRPNGSAINCTSDSARALLLSYVRDSLAANTRRASFSDLKEFEAWGGSLPASPETIAAYLAAHADSLSVQLLFGISPRFQRPIKPEGCPIRPIQNWCERR